MRVRALLAVVRVVFHLITRVDVRATAAAVALQRLVFAQRVVLAIRVINERAGVGIVFLRAGSAGRSDAALWASAVTNDRVVAETMTAETKGERSRRK